MLKHTSVTVQRWRASAQVLHTPSYLGILRGGSLANSSVNLFLSKLRLTHICVSKEVPRRPLRAFARRRRRPSQPADDAQAVAKPPGVGWDSMCHLPHFDTSWVTVDLEGGGAEHRVGTAVLITLSPPGRGIVFGDNWSPTLCPFGRVIVIGDHGLESQTVSTWSWHGL